MVDQNITIYGFRLGMSVMQNKHLMLAFLTKRSWLTIRIIKGTTPVVAVLLARDGA